MLSISDQSVGPITRVYRFQRSSHLIGLRPDTPKRSCFIHTSWVCLPQDKLERADKLVGGLAGEFVRWQASIGSYEAMIERLVGDSLIAAAFVSYLGPFDTVYRYRGPLVRYLIYTPKP